MPETRDEYRILWFDSGSGATGYAFLVFDRIAFCNRRYDIFDYIKFWKTGELAGEEVAIARKAVRLCYQARFEPRPFVAELTIGLEQFELTQLIGGRELLSPVRINAMIEYGCADIGAPVPIYQQRSLRTGVTRDKLKQWGLGWKGKDSFAAMQHAVTYARRLKQKANERPWPLDKRR